MSSFTSIIKSEMSELKIKKTCCRKAFLLGLIFNCTRSNGAPSELSATFIEPSAAIKAEQLLSSVYKCNAKTDEVKKPGKKYMRLTFRSPSVSKVLDALDGETENTIPEAFSFSCTGCSQAFLRGVFIACATVNDPHKGYHLEIALAKENLVRASKLYRLLSICGFVPRIVNRKGSCGLYYKSNSAITDLIYYAGAVKSSFDYANVCIERDIRNNENRATNCVATNISKSVTASQRQIAAIRRLIETHKLDMLPEELKETAKLRFENDEVSLNELAMLHEPPISKSGLNHRLEKICREAEILCKESGGK